MPRFVKRPIKIEARQFKTVSDKNEHNLNGLVLWVNKNGGRAFHDHKNIYIRTLEGIMRADLGDWLIKGTAGEFYPCKPDIFMATYEPIKRG